MLWYILNVPELKQWRRSDCPVQYNGNCCKDVLFLLSHVFSLPNLVFFELFFINSALLFADISASEGK